MLLSIRSPKVQMQSNKHFQVVHWCYVMFLIAIYKACDLLLVIKRFKSFSFLTMLLSSENSILIFCFSVRLVLHSRSFSIA